MHSRRDAPWIFWWDSIYRRCCGRKFPGKLVEFQGAKVEQFSFTNEAQARDVERTLREAARGELRVLTVDRKQRKRNPAPPFTTSTLQQEAARKLSFSAQKTMRVAQQLYEGVDIGEGQVGLITYMRTDSLNLAQEAIGQIRDVIVQLYGQAGLAEEPRIFKTKSKNAQEAHEAIRPTAASVLPADIENKLESDQFRLYSLIWKRTVACQMAPAIFDTVTVEMLAGAEGPKRTVLRANGSTLVKPGYISVYQEGLDDAVLDDSDHVLPPMKEGDRVKLVGIVPSQHFTEPPPRFSEASLVKALEEYGIGRPSTYASIISTLRDRQYVDIESRRFTATDIGKIVSRFLTQYFTTYVDRVNHTESSVSREEVAQARDLGPDPASGKPMSVRMGRFGPFVQIGTKDDEDKPRFAGLRPGQKMDQITHAQAMELFKLPRKLGTTAGGEEITTNVGRFGPYVKYGAKYVSLRTDDPYEITPERALEVIREKEIADANRLILDFPDAGIQVLNGRYGPYITDKARNAKIPKDKEPKSLTLEECVTLLAAAPERGKWGRRGGKGSSKGSKFAPKGAVKGAKAAKASAGAPEAANAVAAPVKLAAKRKKAAVNKRAPLKPSAASKGKPTAKKKSPAKKQS